MNTKIPLKVRRKLPLIGYLILAGAVALAFYTLGRYLTNKEGDRKARAALLAQSDIDLCNAINSERKIFRGIIIRGNNDTKKLDFYKKLSKADKNKIEKSTKVTLKQLRPVKCGKLPSSKLNPKLNPKKKIHTTTNTPTITEASK